MQRRIKSLMIIILIILFAISSGCIDDLSNEKNYITIQGKDEIYLTIMDAISGSLDGDIILVSEGIYNETLIINKSISLIGENKNTTFISGNKTGDVIHITANFVNISGFTIKNCGDEYSYGVDAGIDIRSDNNIISDNIIGSNGNYGLYLYTQSKNNIIIHSVITENRFGIYLNYANENNISSNTFSLNADNGIYLGSQSRNNLISNNIISENQQGTRIKGSEYNKITQNLFVNNNRGLYFCCGAKNNIVFLNSFKNNSEWNAKDGNINQWDYRELGNYWDDYNGLDSNGDRIGDTPYEVSTGEKLDNYPLMESYEIYI